MEQRYSHKIPAYVVKGQAESETCVWAVWADQKDAENCVLEENKAERGLEFSFQTFGFRQRLNNFEALLEDAWNISKPAQFPHTDEDRALVRNFEKAFQEEPLKAWNWTLHGIEYRDGTRIRLDLGSDQGEVYADIRRGLSGEPYVQVHTCLRFHWADEVSKALTAWLKLGAEY